MYYLTIFEDIINTSFLRYALYAGLAVGILAPLIGSVVVIRRLSLIADTLGHFSLAGVAIGVFFAQILSVNFNLRVILGVLFSIAGTFIIEKLRGFYKNYKELSMPILMSFGAAITGIFISKISGFNTTGYLFGSIYSIKKFEIIIILILSLIVFLFIILLYKKIVLVCFDEIYAKVSGINVRLIQLGITVILALIISIFLELVGVLLISALMIIPVAAAILIGDSFKNTIFFSILFSEISIIFGFIFSYYFYLPTGSTIVLFNISILLIIMFFKLVKRIRYRNKDNNHLEPL